MISSDLLLPQDWSCQGSWQVPQALVPDWIMGTASENAGAGTANCTECHQQSSSAAQHTENSPCKDLSTSPAAEDSARPCWFSHLISFKNICHLDGVSHGLASIWKQLWSVWRIPFRIFWQKNMKNCSFLYVSESKWELYQNLTFLMEVVFSML